MLKIPTSSTAIRILRPTQSRSPTSSDAQFSKDPVDPITLCNEFDRARAVQELAGKLELAGFADIEIVPVSLDTIMEVVDMLERDMEGKRTRNQDLVVFQLCDGTELDGYPGVSIIQELENRKIAFTGSDTVFYIISSSKPILKRELQTAHVPTSSFQEFSVPPKMADLDNIINEIGFPMIVKPSISYASLSISLASVVHTPKQLLEQVNQSLCASNRNIKVFVSNQKRLEQGQEQVQEQEQKQAEHKNDTNIKASLNEKTMGYDIETPTVFVEKFLAGREFTVLVVGDKDWGIKVYPAAERIFDPKLGKFERLLSFDQYWDGWDLEGGKGNGNDNICKHQMANQAWQEQLQEVAKNAYLALQGSGYGRVDIRTVDMDNCEPVVLEVNANCGLSFEKDSSSMANILIMSGVSPIAFVRDLVDQALHRNRKLEGTMDANALSKQPSGNCTQNSSVEGLISLPNC